jgi:hypothetical protein
MQTRLPHPLAEEILESDINKEELNTCYKYSNALNKD